MAFVYNDLLNKSDYHITFDKNIITNNLTDDSFIKYLTETTLLVEKQLNSTDFEENLKTFINELTNNTQYNVFQMYLYFNENEIVLRSNYCIFFAIKDFDNKLGKHSLKIHKHVLDTYKRLVCNKLKDLGFSIVQLIEDESPFDANSTFIRFKL